MALPSPRRPSQRVEALMSHPNPSVFNCVDPSLASILSRAVDSMEGLEDSEYYEDV